MTIGRFMGLGRWVWLAALVSCHTPWLASAVGADSLRESLNDEHAAGDDHWIYNHIPSGIAEAHATDKPLLVTFRCVPCQACKGFDADVTGGNEAVENLIRDHFVAVRQVEMKGVDLSQYQFDYDLSWAALFLHPDGTVYARYGTQSAAGPDAYNSVTGFERTIRRVLEMHAQYPANRAELAEKRGSPKPYQTALDMPGLEHKDRLARATHRNNCIHCHTIHDAEHRYAQAQGTFHRDMLWRYPLPENIGLTIDRDDGIRIASVAEHSPAARAGLRIGDQISHMEGQRIASIADMQWVLDHLPNDDVALTIKTTEGRQHQLQLVRGWKQTDISWRGSLWSVSPRLNVWTPPLSAARRSELGLDAKQPALEVRWINREKPGGRAAFDAGLREGDVLVQLDGQPVAEDGPHFHMHIKLHYSPGDHLPLTVWRDGRRETLHIPLVE